MIQRIQSVWLLLAAICGFLVAKVPIYTGSTAANAPIELFASSSLLLYALLIGIACLCCIAIFLFKNRPLQTRLCIINIILCILAVALEVKNVEDGKTTPPAIVKGTYQLGALLPLLIIIFLIMAIRGIRKDQKLVKSLDRLR